MEVLGQVWPRGSAVRGFSRLPCRVAFPHTPVRSIPECGGPKGPHLHKGSPPSDPPTPTECNCVYHLPAVPRTPCYVFPAVILQSVSPHPDQTGASNENTPVSIPLSRSRTAVWPGGSTSQAPPETVAACYARILRCRMRTSIYRGGEVLCSADPILDRVPRNDFLASVTVEYWKWGCKNRC